MVATPVAGAALRRHGPALATGDRAGVCSAYGTAAFARRTDARLVDRTVAAKASGTRAPVIARAGRGACRAPLAGMLRL